MKEEVKTTILRAFADTPYPSDERLVLDQTGADPECNQIAAGFRGKLWKDMSATHVRQFADSLPLFTPEGFRYFLPAYMMASIDAPGEVDVAKQSVVFHLTPPRDKSGWEARFFRDRADLFSVRERAALVDFLKLMQQREAEDWASAGLPVPNDDFERALAYWSVP